MPAEPSHLDDNEYRCAACGGIFEKGWSDEEAAGELASTFKVPADDCSLVCDDCYKLMMVRIN
jgi:uncharacterized protein with PIN domain